MGFPLAIVVEKQKLMQDKGTVKEISHPSSRSTPLVPTCLRSVPIHYGLERHIPKCTAYVYMEGRHRATNTCFLMTLHKTGKHHLAAYPTLLQYISGKGYRIYRYQIRRSSTPRGPEYYNSASRLRPSTKVWWWAASSWMAFILSVPQTEYDCGL